MIRVFHRWRGDRTFRLAWVRELAARPPSGEKRADPPVAGYASLTLVFCLATKRCGVHIDGVDKPQAEIMKAPNLPLFALCYRRTIANKELLGFVSQKLDSPAQIDIERGRHS